MRKRNFKTCCRCRVLKRVEEFYSSKNRESRSAACKECSKINKREWDEKNREKRIAYAQARIKRLRDSCNPRYLSMRKLSHTKDGAKKYGYIACNATIDEVESRFRTDCEICGREVGRSIHLDHCHKSGDFRGFICGRCNSLLGFAGDSVELLRKAIIYLKR